MRASHLTAFCLLMLTTILLAACSSKPESVVETFYKAAAAGDVEKATAQISFATVKGNEMVQAKGKIQMMVGELKNQIDANDGLKKVEVLESSVDGDSAKAQVKLIFNNGKDNTENYTLVREEGKWKIKLF